MKNSDQQINRIYTSDSLAFSAHENGIVRAFDTTSLKQLKFIHAHSEGINSIITVSNHSSYLLTGGCDGYVKVWDIRKWGCVSEIQAHSKKYSDGVCSISVHTQMPFIATSGADGIAKIYTVQI